MIAITIEDFDKAMAQHFAPLVSNNTGLALRKLAEGVYEVCSANFAMLIRHGTGHHKSILVTLLSTKERPTGIEDLSKDIGLGVIAEFYGEKLVESPFDSREDYLREAGKLASAAERFLFPYLLGLRDNLNDVRAFIEQKIENSGIQTKKWNFPKNVREEW